jgi:hypothetical protein
METMALGEVAGGLPRFPRQAAQEEIVTTNRGRPAGVLRGFGSDEEWFDYQVEHDPAFLARVARAREQARAGRLTSIEGLRAQTAAELAQDQGRASAGSE